MTFLEIRAFFERLSIILEFCDNLTRIAGTVHEDPYTFMIILSCPLGYGVDLPPS